MFIMQISIVILDRHYLKNIKKGTIHVISRDHLFNWISDLLYGTLSPFFGRNLRGNMIVFFSFENTWILSFFFMFLLQIPANHFNTEITIEMWQCSERKTSLIQSFLFTWRFIGCSCESDMSRNSSTFPLM